MSAAPMRERARQRFAALQDEICVALEALDGAGRFGEDRWTHAGGEGGGITRVLGEGALIEKGGVNFSAVGGRLSERLAQRLRVRADGFFATGVSLVLHPRSPMVPTVHMNVRYLELAAGDAWFGGGADLTPYYLFEDDAAHFHRALKRACDAHDPARYPRYKRACDEYFRIEHRGEARGVGGIFFDYLRDDPEAGLAFVGDVGRAFTGAWVPIAERRRDEPWGERERRWQLARRGRYVEFNLVHDRGTLFGLETGGRTESILMSLPPLVAWPYGHHPDPGSREADLLEVLRNPREWV